jgi:predicted small lipoprotein YifL
MTLFSLPHRSRPYRLTISAALALLVASGCGQKGALYLPDDPSELQTLEPATEASTEESSETAEPEAAADGESSETEEAEEETGRRPPNETELP